jgi:hypothetical protein
MKRYFLAFVLIFFFLAPLCAQKSDKVTTPVAQEQTFSIVLKGRTLQIQNIKVGDKIEILNILGVRVLEKRSDSTYIELQLELPQGYYIVKVGTLVRKISVK